MTYTPPPFPVGLRPGSANPSAKPLQEQLKNAGLLPQSVLYDDVYGPYTQEAVKKFHAISWNADLRDEHPEAIGPVGWQRLHYYALAEPANDMHHTTYGGRLVNQRTKILLTRMGNYQLAQGSYSTAVSASAGTHSGGGIVDFSVAGMSDTTRRNLVQLARKMGFAAWLRNPSQGPWPYHIHACAIGDPQMAPSAKQQVRDYFAGRNGLVGGHPDDGGPRPIPHWALKYK